MTPMLRCCVLTIADHPGWLSGWAAGGAISGLDAEAVRGILFTAGEMIHGMTGRCQLTMTGENRQSIQLDGVMVMALPDRVRLRVWKLDQAVFDLTVLPEGLWIETAPQMSGASTPGPLIPATLALRG